MKKLKTFDLLVNITLIVGFAIYCIIKQDGSYLVACFVVGAWQVVSMLFHAYNHILTYKNGSRYYYHWVAATSLLSIPVGFIWILLFAAPFLAIYYTYLCYHEVSVKMQRPLAVLK